jgi:hypothetical protein
MYLWSNDQEFKNFQSYLYYSFVSNNIQMYVNCKNKSLIKLDGMQEVESSSWIT